MKWIVKHSTSPIADTGDFYTQYWLEKEGWPTIYLSTDDEECYKEMADRLNDTQPSEIKPTDKDAILKDAYEFIRNKTWFVTDAEGEPYDKVMYPHDAKKAIDIALQSSNESKDREIAELKDAIRGILKEPHGCPMCDSGILRDKEKEHWNDCPYLIAEKILKS